MLLEPKIWRVDRLRMHHKMYNKFCVYDRLTWTKVIVDLNNKFCKVM